MSAIWNNCSDIHEEVAWCTILYVCVRVCECMHKGETLEDVCSLGFTLT